MLTSYIAAPPHKAPHEANFILRYRTIMLFLQARSKARGEGGRGSGAWRARKKGDSCSAKRSREKKPACCRNYARSENEA